MASATNGATVKVHYTGKLDDGTVFDSSKERDPIEFTVGQNQVIPGFESAIVGMEVGEKKTETIPAEKAYGPRRDELLMEVDKGQFPGDIDPAIGQALRVKSPDGKSTQVKVADVKDKTVVLDANHPLAGKDLIFEIELLDVSS